MNKTKTVNMNDVMTLLGSLVSRIEAMETPAPVKAVKGPKASGKVTKAKGNYEAKKARIETAKTEALSRSMKDAVKLAVSQVKHNQAQGFVNAKIEAVSPTSYRRFLQSHENQALRATRDANGVKYAEVEAMLEKAIA